MTNTHSGRKFSGSLAIAACLTFFPLVFSACASEEPAVTAAVAVAVRDEPVFPLLLFDTSQVAVYNGQPQPISYYYSGNGKPEIIYYSSQKARMEDRGGSTAAPVRAGTYYVRARLTSENKHTPVREVLAEYWILKSQVKIEAEEIQYTYYNGDQKRIKAKVEPPVPLFYSYYPNRELMETAQRAVEEPIPGESSIRLLTKTYSGYKRVDRTPFEEGTYYVWIYFPGDENHEAANANVEFTILPRR